jgi:tetratricopeptide (TPR) repeat protein
MFRSRSLVVLLLAVVAAAAQSRQPDPIDAAIQDYHRLHSEGRHDEAAAQRDALRTLVGQAPVDATQFVNWVQMVSQMYEQAGKAVEERSVVEAALARANHLPDAHPTRVALLTMLARSWQSDGSLLKAAGYLEQAAAALESGSAAAYRNPGDLAQIYRQLGDLYRQLGRPEAAAAAFARVESRLRSNPLELAYFYLQEGPLDQAEALFKQLADQSRNPQDATNALKALIGLYQNQNRLDEAASAEAQAIAIVQNSGEVPLRNQLGWMRQNLASFLQQAGQIQQAEQVYAQALSDPQGDPFSAVTGYAGLLSSTQRTAQAEKLLSDYLVDQGDANPIQAANVLNMLADMSGDPKQAQEYRRAAADKWPMPPTAAPANLIGDVLRAAQMAAVEGRLDDAYSLSLQAISAAPTAPDREMIAPWGVLSVADVIAGKQPAKAEQLYRRLLAAVEEWSGDTVNPLAMASLSYIGFLMRRADRRDAVAAAIGRYGAIVAAARGADAGTKAVLDRTIDFEGSSNSLERAIFLLQERLRLEESLSGNTSQPYLNALGVLVSLYERSGDHERVLQIHRQMIAIADLVAMPNDQQRARIRMNAAVAFATARQFDEADRLAAEAMAIAKGLRPSPENQLAWQLALWENEI